MNQHNSELIHTQNISSEVRTQTFKQSLDANAFNNKPQNNDIYNYENRNKKLFQSTVGDLGDGTLNEALIEDDLSKDSNQYKTDMYENVIDDEDEYLNQKKLRMKSLNLSGIGNKKQSMISKKFSGGSNQYLFPSQNISKIQSQVLSDFKNNFNNTDDF